MATYQILYWQDIPAQLKIQGTGRPESFILPDPFQHKIDRLAMQQGLGGTDAYLEQWKWSAKIDFSETPDALKARLVQELTAQHLTDADR